MEKDIKQLLDMGRAAFEKNDYARALAFFSEILGESGQFADVYNMLGVIFYDKGNYPAARTAFRRALEINPDFSDAALNLIITLNDMGVQESDRKATLESLGVKVPQRDDMDEYVKNRLANRYCEIGEIYAGINRFDEAIEEYKRALALRPEFHDIRLLMAVACKNKGDLAAAIAECSIILNKKPEFHEARNLLGLCHHIAGDNDSAMTQWRQVLSLDRENKLAKLYLSSVQEKLKEKENS